MILPCSAAGCTVIAATSCRAFLFFASFCAAAKKDKDRQLVPAPKQYDQKTMYANSFTYILSLKNSFSSIAILCISDVDYAFFTKYRQISLLD